MSRGRLRLPRLTLFVLSVVIPQTLRADGLMLGLPVEVATGTEATRVIAYRCESSADRSR